MCGKTKCQGSLSPSMRLSLIPNSLSASLRLFIAHITPLVVSLLLQTILEYMFYNLKYWRSVSQTAPGKGNKVHLILNMLFKFFSLSCSHALFYWNQYVLEALLVTFLGLKIIFFSEHNIMQLHRFIKD